MSSSCSPLRSSSRTSSAGLRGDHPVQRRGPRRGLNVPSASAVIRAAPSRSGRGRRPPACGVRLSGPRACTSRSAHQAVTVGQQLRCRRRRARRTRPGGDLGHPAGAGQRRRRSVARSSPGGASNRRLPPDRRRGRAARGVPCGDHLAVVDDDHLVGQPLGLVHEVGGEHDGHAVVPQVGRPAPRWRAAPAGPARRSARRGTPAPAARRPPARARAAAAGHRTAAGTACGRPAQAEPLDQGRDVERVGVQRGHVPEHLLGAHAGVDAALLEHHADPRPQGARVGDAGPGPSTRTVPESGRRYPSQLSTVVVLPAPLGPSTAVIAPGSTVQRQPVDRGLVAVPLDQVDDLDRGCHARSLRSAPGPAPGGRATGPDQGTRTAPGSAGTVRGRGEQFAVPGK